MHVPDLQARIAEGDGGNDWTTFDGATASLAAGIVGQPGYTFEVSLNGKWKNLEGIIAPGGALPTQAVAPGTTVAAGQTVQQGPTEVVGAANRAADNRMAFYGALKNAALIVSSLYEGAGPEAFDQAMEHLKIATERIQSGAKAAEQGLPEVPATLPNDGTPAGVAEAVNAVAGDGAVATGAAVAW